MSLTEICIRNEKTVISCGWIILGRVTIHHTSAQLSLTDILTTLNNFCILYHLTHATRLLWFTFEEPELWGDPSTELLGVWFTGTLALSTEKTTKTMEMERNVSKQADDHGKFKVLTKGRLKWPQKYMRVTMVFFNLILLSTENPEGASWWVGGLGRQHSFV